MVDQITADDAGRAKLMGSIKEWYDGYSMFGRELYTPWSVMNYLADCIRRIDAEPKGAWVASGADKVLEELAKLNVADGVVENLKKLADGEAVSLADGGSGFKLLDKLRQSIIDEQVVVYILYNSGYLKKDNELNYVIPNKEVMLYFKDKVLNAWLWRKCNLGDNAIASLPTLLRGLNDRTEFKRVMEDIILKRVVGERSEAYFQGVVGGGIKLACLSDTRALYRVQFEKPVVSGGRIDNIFYPTKYNKEKTVIIHEYKKLDRTAYGEAENITNGAMWQIIEKHYLKEPVIKIEEHKYLDWQKVKMRAVTFERNEEAGSERQWIVQVKEIELAMETAKKIVQFFEREEVREILKVGIKGRKEIETRNDLLRKTRCADLEELLTKIEICRSENPGINGLAFTQLPQKREREEDELQPANKIARG